MSDVGFTQGIETKDLVSGWAGIVQFADGTARKVWAPTEARARAKAQEVLDE